MAVANPLLDAKFINQASESEIESKIQTGNDVNERDVYGYFPLYHAIYLDATISLNCYSRMGRILTREGRMGGRSCTGWLPMGILVYYISNS